MSEDADRFVHVYNTLALAGGVSVAFGLFSRLLKEKLFLSEPLVATLTGILFGPLVIGDSAWSFLLNSSSKESDSDSFAVSTNVNIPLAIEFCRLVISVQVFIAGMQLPTLYPVRKWVDMTVLLGPVLLVMCGVSSLIVYALSGRSALESFVIGTSLGPTDPVLASSIVTGRFARLYIHRDIRDVITAESAANDGLGALFVGLPLLILTHGSDGIGRWFYEILLLDVVVAAILGALLGLLCGALLTHAEARHWLDKQSFSAFSIAFSLFLLGLLQQIRGISAIFGIFVAGVTFSSQISENHRVEQSHAQEAVDLLLTFGFFLWFGMVLPWERWNAFGLGRLFGIGILVLIFRRIPALLLFHNAIPETRLYKEAIFIGWFGPVGASSLFYALDTQLLAGYEFGAYEIVTFVMLCSVIFHGVTAAPFAKLMATATEERMKLKNEVQEELALQRRALEREHTNIRMELEEKLPTKPLPVPEMEMMPPRQRSPRLSPPAIDQQDQGSHCDGDGAPPTTLAFLLTIHNPENDAAAVATLPIPSPIDVNFVTEGPCPQPQAANRQLAQNPLTVPPEWSQPKMSALQLSDSETASASGNTLSLSDAQTATGSGLQLSNIEVTLGTALQQTTDCDGTAQPRDTGHSEEPL